MAQMLHEGYKSPCKDCESRNIHCHSTRKDYIAYKNTIESMKKYEKENAKSIKRRYLTNADKEK